jgi:hypothetical protein
MRLRRVRTPGLQKTVQGENRGENILAAIKVRQA